MLQIKSKSLQQMLVQAVMSLEHRTNFGTLSLRLLAVSRQTTSRLSKKLALTAIYKINVITYQFKGRGVDDSIKSDNYNNQTQKVDARANALVCTVKLAQPDVNLSCYCITLVHLRFDFCCFNCLSSSCHPETFDAFRSRTMLLDFVTENRQ